MAFSGSVVTSSYRKERNQAVHDLLGDVIKMAVYTNAATLNAATTVYTATGEVVNANYTAGGKILVMSLTLATPAGDPVVAFTNPSWNPGGFLGRGYLIYNFSKGNKSMYVGDFGQDRTADPFIVKCSPSGLEICTFAAA